MVEPLRPTRGVFLRPFGGGLFVREFLLGQGPDESPRIDPDVGAPQADIFYYYKVALLKAIALDRATKQEEWPISPAEIERLAEKHLSRIPYKSTSCRYHSFLVYFSNFKKLVGIVDILVENNPLGTMTSLWLDYETLKKINPRLIMTSITPFGQTGTYRDYKASDLVTFHMSGYGYMDQSDLSTSELIASNPAPVPALQGWSTPPWPSSRPAPPVCALEDKVWDCPADCPDSLCPAYVSSSLTSDKKLQFLSLF